MSIKFLRHYILYVGLAFSINSHAELTSLNKVIAIVDNKAILASDLGNKIKLLSRDNKFIYNPHMREKILEELILESLQLDLAKRLKLKVTKTQVNKIMRHEVATNVTQMTPAIIKNLRKQIRNNLLIQQLRYIEVPKTININDNEINIFLNSLEGKKIFKNTYLIQHALIDLSDNHVINAQEIITEQENSLKQTTIGKSAVVKSLHQKLNSNISLGELQKLFNQPNIKIKQFGPSSKEKLPSSISNLLDKLKIGQVYGPVITADSVRFIKLVEIHNVKNQKDIQQWEVRHILLIPTEQNTQAEIKQQLIDLSNSINSNKATFTQMAKEHSADKNSGSRGGSLGWITLNDISDNPQFVTAIKNTPVGQISSPFFTKFGGHIVQITAKRKVAANNYINGIVRQKLFEQKYPAALLMWLQSIRKEAYIDIKPRGS